MLASVDLNGHGGSSMTHHANLPLARLIYGGDATKAADRVPAAGGESTRNLVLFLSATINPMIIQNVG